jgi:hypothetical protein
MMKNKHHGSTLDSLFEELGELDEVNAAAAKRALALEAERRTKQGDGPQPDSASPRRGRRA